jgi:GT2 family glycosyltransferase
MANKVSIIIPNYNGAKIILSCLKSVYASSYTGFEVFLIDDASEDNSVSVVRNFFPQTKILRNAKNLGFARTANKGFKESRAEIVVLLNMDTVVRKEWLSELIKVLISDGKIGIAGSKILDTDGKTIQHAGGLINSNGITTHIGRGEVDIGQYDSLREVDYVCGASMALRKKLLEDAGYLDEDYSPLYYEDTDLAFQARKKGYKVVYAPKAVLTHTENYSTGGLTARFYYLYHKNRIRFVLKNFSLKYFFTEFLKAESGWFREFQPKEQKARLVSAYLANLFQLPCLLFKTRCFNRLTRGYENK